MALGFPLRRLQQAFVGLTTRFYQEQLRLGPTLFGTRFDAAEAVSYTRASFFSF
jgi:hypothetical protein